MPRFFMIGSNIPDGGTVLLTGTNAEHAKVLRLKAGDRIVICDGAGRDCHCTVTRMTRETVEAKADKTVPCPAEPGVRAVVLAGLPAQSARSDYVVQKCTESGAAEIVFFPSRRCTAIVTRKGIEKRLIRWRRIAEEAAKQSGRGVIPRIAATENYAGALDIAAKTELPLFLYETGERTPLRAALTHAGEFKSCAILTGPEGGFAPYEAELARQLGVFQICSMGPRIFRCETAPVAALISVMYETGNL